MSSCDRLKRTFLFHGLALPNGSRFIPLVYVDDVLFIGKWFQVNFFNPKRLFR